MATKPITPWFEVTVGAAHSPTTARGGSDSLAKARPPVAWWQYLEQLGRRGGKA